MTGIVKSQKASYMHVVKRIMNSINGRIVAPAKTILVNILRNWITYL